MDDTAAGAPCAQARTGRGHDCLAKLVQGTVCKILGQEEIKPHKVRYYLERRAPYSRQAGIETALVRRGAHTGARY